MHKFIDHSKRDHALSRADARIKILVALLLLVMVLSCRGYAFPIILTALSLVAALVLQVPRRAFVLRFAEPLFMAGLIVLLKLFFSGREVLFSTNILGVGIAGHADGLIEGLRIAARIIAAVSVVAMLGFSTPFTEIMAGLAWFRVPRGFVEILMFAYRYLFLLYEDATVIYTAQKNRLGYATMKRGLGSFGVLAGALTLKAFENSQNTTVAMVQRGYDGTMPLLRHRPFDGAQIAASLLLLSGMGFLWSL